MNTLRMAPTLTALAVLVAVTAGCSRATDVTVYEPGVYKGAKDPLVSSHAAADHKERLRERFSTGQVDR